MMKNDKQKGIGMEATLVILAAGLGSRFGGDKQISCVGPHGEILMEYSIRDAIDAGFTRVVFILKSGMVDFVREKIGDRLSGTVEVSYAVQSYEDLPRWYRVPEDRVKPFGTVHAVLAAAPYIKTPFATVNADDYYGKEAFRILYRKLSELKRAEDACMVPYILGNTMSENGGVTRGICRIEKGLLKQVDETRNIVWGSDRVPETEGRKLDPASEVSMNIWGFHHDLLPRMQAYFEAFLRGLEPGEKSAECLLPIMVNDFLEEGKLTVGAESSFDRWFGITFPADKDSVSEELNRLHREGAYPERLF